MLTPKYAAEGFYVDNDKIDIITYVSKRFPVKYPELRQKAKEDTIKFMSEIQTETFQTNKIDIDPVL